MNLPTSFKRKFDFYDCLERSFFFYYPLRSVIASKKAKLVDVFLSYEASNLLERYAKKKNPSGRIGNRIWFFWYDGINVAPAVVKKCYASLKSAKDVDIMLIDKSNLYDVCPLPVHITDKFAKGQITIQTLSDIVRNKLISLYGGFWFDATIYLIDKDFINERKSLDFYTVRLDAKKTKFFNAGKWCTFLFGGCKNNILASFATDFYDWYFKNYDSAFDYFLIDYIYLFGYKHIPEIKRQIDRLDIENEHVFWLLDHFYEKYDEDKWNYLERNNHLQKLVWKVKSKNIEGTNLEHFLNS